MSKDFKPLAYYYARRNFNDLLIQSCEANLAKKGKDPIILFWKAYGLGKCGYINECLKQLDVFHNRKDLQLPVTLAMLYFHKNAPNVDHETVDTLTAEISIAEDVTKELGIVLAARFSLITGDYEMASRLSQKITSNVSSNSQHATPTELEAICIDLWSTYYLSNIDNMGGPTLGGAVTSNASAIRSIITRIESVCRNSIENCDLDMSMLWVACKLSLNSLNDAMDILNQIIALYPGFSPALSEKVALQLQHCQNNVTSHGSDWEPVLDSAQRLLDEDKASFDALLIFTLHSFTQDGDMNEALMKLDDLDKCLQSSYPSSLTAHLTVAITVTQICCRNNRAIKVCCDILERIVSHPAVSSKPENQCSVLTELGRIKLLLGPSGCSSAIQYFREALKKDEGHDSISALLGMIQGQIIEGEIDDAEAQLELLTVMHDKDELGVEYSFINALLAKKSNTFVNMDAPSYEENGKEDRDTSTSRSNASKATLALQKQKQQKHLAFLQECCQFLIPDMHWADKDSYQLRPVFNHNLTEISRTQLIDPLYVRFAAINPDMLLSIALEYLTYQEIYTPANTYLPNPTSIATTAASLTAAAGTSGTGKDEAVTAGATGSEDTTEVSVQVQTGLHILKLVLSNFPGFLCVYVETSRVLAGINRHEDACRTLHQCINISPRNTIALIFKAKVEAARMQSMSADRCLEQALSYDFSVRSSTLYRLVRAQVWSLQAKYDEAITELQQLVQLPEMRTLSKKITSKSTSTSSSKNNDYDDNRYKYEDNNNNNSSSSNANNDAYYSYADSYRVSDEDKISVFVLLGYLYGRTKKMKDAKAIFNDAKTVFVGSGLEYVLLLASSQFAVDRKDFDAALKMLDKVHDYSSAYHKAQIAKADILLTHLRDQDGYLRCFQQLVDKDPSCNNYIALGEASLRILRPEAAVNAFEKAYELDRKNFRLRGRIGRILISTHEYFRAVDYYETAIRELSGTSGHYEEWGSSGVDSHSNNSSNHNNSNGEISSDLVSLSHDLAKLLMKLGRGEASARVLNNALHLKHNDLTDLQQDVLTYMILADVSKALDRDNADITDLYKKAYELQRSVLSKIRSASSAVATLETVDKQKKVMSNICEKLGTISLQDNTRRRSSAALSADKASIPEQYLNEAIQYQSNNTKALISLAKLYLNTNDLDKCCIMCKKTLVEDPTSEDASVMLSEALFLSDSSMEASNKAIEPLQNLLQLQPNNYVSLSRFISLLRRLGELEKAKEYITKAEKFDIKSKGHPGYHYCQGLYYRYTNDVASAIISFNKARKDTQWGAEALTQMIELYLNPDQQGVWDHTGSGSSSDEKDNSNSSNHGGGGNADKNSYMDESTAEHVAVAQVLLDELKPITKDPLKFELLENQYFVATRQKSMIDRAMTSFQKMLDDEPDYLPAILGMASGYMMEKNEHKARNLLKRVATMEKSARDGEDFNIACLLLAKFYVDQTKYSAAQELCKKCLEQDRSSAKAWDILGLSMEKELDYEHASDCFLKAWTLEFEASASIGFKLAFCYLKTRKYTEAIGICEKVLALYPDYPRIKEEILKKAINNIRGGGS